MRPPPKLLFVVTEDWFFVSHFMSLALAARAAGYSVCVVTRVRQDALAALIERQGIRLIRSRHERGQFGPLALLGHVAWFTALFRTERPDVVHLVSVRLIVLAGVAALLSGVRARVLAVTGLGLLGVSRGIKAESARRLLGALLRGPLGGRYVRYVFENREDPRTLGLRLDDRRVAIVGGAGIDPERESAQPMPPMPPLRIAVVARMVHSKGIDVAVEALRRARGGRGGGRTLAVGAPDPENPRSLDEATLRAWADEPGIAWHGHSSDVAAVWREHHVVCVPSAGRRGSASRLARRRGGGPRRGDDRDAWMRHLRARRDRGFRRAAGRPGRLGGGLPDVGAGSRPHATLGPRGPSPRARRLHHRGRDGALPRRLPGPRGTMTRTSHDPAPSCGRRPASRRWRTCPSFGSTWPRRRPTSGRRPRRNSGRAACPRPSGPSRGRGPGARAYLLDHPATVRGRHVLDVASGSGLVALAAARAGAARVEANDIDGFALAAIALNAAANGVCVEPLAGDIVGEDHGWDVVLAADIFYEADTAAACSTGSTPSRVAAPASSSATPAAPTSHASASTCSPATTCRCRARWKMPTSSARACGGFRR